MRRRSNLESVREDTAASLISAVGKGGVCKVERLEKVRRGRQFGLSVAGRPGSAFETN